ncbi:hypothetical protein CA831_09110, partial [Burkholderia multivorans]
MASPIEHALLDAFRQFFPGAQTVGSYVNGELVEGRGDTIQLFDAATGEQSLAYRDGGAEIVALAASAAQA